MRDAGGSVKTSSHKGLSFSRFFTQENFHPYDQVKWEKRTAQITGDKGEVIFEQEVEFPDFWSDTAVQIVASKYFRGQLGTPEREYSLKQLIDRVVSTIGKWGREGNYFASGDSDIIFEEELTYLMLHQVMLPNSPVLFNLGWNGRKQAVSACYITACDDSMESILDLYKIEGMLFKDGSGAGSSLSTLRSSKEPLSAGGISGGPIPFMKGLDANAGSIRSGGSVRRAALLRCLNVDHPDILEFINCKPDAEKKAHALIEAGFDPSFNVPYGAYDSVHFQNANISVRVPDEFMKAVENDSDWHLKKVTTGEIIETVKAKELFHKIAKAAYLCADPGLQFHDTINKWNGVKNSGTYESSNPCCFVGETLIVTEGGNTSIGNLLFAQEQGWKLPEVKVHDERRNFSKINRVWKSGETTELVEVSFNNNGPVLLCTPEHPFLSIAPNGYIQAKDLEEYGTAKVKKITLDVPISVYDMEIEEVHNFAVTSPGSDYSVVAHNSEFHMLNWTSCNLASLNLLKFLNDDNSFNVQAFKAGVELTATMQEIGISGADFPTEKIKQMSRDFRPIGIGYANLGALLMAKGLAYDSDEGRNFAKSITALLSGTAFKQSAHIASVCGGPFAEFYANSDHMLGKISAYGNLAMQLSDSDISKEALDQWHKAFELGRKYGVRNCEISCAAPTGTIGLAMGCDTTGIEPSIGLVAYKKLVGGGAMKFVNGTIDRGLKSLGYHDREVRSTIVEYVSERGTPQGCSVFNNEHLPVFDCALPSQDNKRSISPMGHLKMLAAVQEFFSMGVSKCLTGDTIISIADRGLVRLASFYDGSQSIDSFVDISGEVYSKAGKNKLISQFYYGGEQATLAIELSDGRQLKGRGAHRILVSNGKGLSWKSFDELKIGDWVAHSIGANNWGKDQRIDFNEEKLYGSQKKHLYFPDFMSPELALLMGMITADGHIVRGTYTVGITKNCNEVLSKFAFLMKALFNLESTYSVDSRTHAKQMVVHSKSLIQFLDHVGFTKEYVPDIILSSSRESVLAYVSGLYLDGWVVKRGLCISQKRVGLINDLRYIWDNLGIPTHESANVVNGRNYPTLHISSGFRKQAADLLMFFEPHKIERVDNLDNGDLTAIFPFPVLREEMKHLTRKQSGSANNSIYNCLASDTHNIRTDTFIKIAEQLQFAYDPELTQYRYLQVRAISDNGNQQVFDLSVPGTHAYVANGIVSHNTINCPNDSTVEDIEQIYMDAWKMGIKSISVYRDGCKASQPLNVKKETSESTKGITSSDTQVVTLQRRRLPDNRPATCHKFDIAGNEGYIHVGFYDDGTPGEVFIRMAKEGSTISGLMDTIATLTSMALQYGVPLETLVNKFRHVRFEPSGFTKNKNVPYAKSLTDYLFGYLQHLPNNTLQYTEEKPELPRFEISKNSDIYSDGPSCTNCGTLMIRSGACFICRECGSTSGCS